MPLPREEVTPPVTKIYFAITQEFERQMPNGFPAETTVSAFGNDNNWLTGRKRSGESPGGHAKLGFNSRCSVAIPGACGKKTDKYPAYMTQRAEIAYTVFQRPVSRKVNTAAGKHAMPEGFFRFETEHQ
jgi:hypothetical protein